MYLAKGWELSAEPNTKEGLRSLIEVLSAEDDDGAALTDNYKEGKEREAIEGVLRRMSRGLASGWYEKEGRVVLDFQTLLGVVSSFTRPGWRVSMTLLEDGSLGYAHRPMSTDEILAHLVLSEGTSEVLSQVGDYLDVYGHTEEFRHFFFGPDSC